MTDTYFQDSEPREYNLLTPAWGSSGESLTDRTTFLIVMWLVAGLFLLISWLPLGAGIVPLDLALYIGFGLQIIGLIFYLPLILFYKNEGFKAFSRENTLTWAIVRKKTVLWSDVQGASKIKRKQRVQEKKSLILTIKIHNRKKPFKLYFEEESGLRFVKELENRGIQTY